MTQEIVTVIWSPHPHLIGYMEMASHFHHKKSPLTLHKEPLEFNEGDVGIPGGIQAPR